MNNTDFYPAIRPKFLLALEILVGTTCILSILGASLIILTYVAYKDLRTTARQLLVNLSVADWIVAASHFVGIFHYKTFIPQYNRHYRSNTDTLCSVQGAFAMFSTVASFLWTISLAAYMFTIIVWRRPKLAKRLVVLFYLVCWGIPTILTIWFGFEKFFGFIETTDVVSCYLRNVSSRPHDPENIYPEVLGYEVWSYLVFVILPIFYIAIFCYIKCKRFDGHDSQTTRARCWSRPTNVDLKLIFVPLIFLSLRVWSAILDFVGFFLSSDEATDFLQSPYITPFVLLGGIGNSAQGLANAILFCACTRQVRKKLYKSLTSPYQRCRQFVARRNDWEAIPEAKEELKAEPTTQFENSVDWKDDTSVDGQATPLVGVSSGSFVSNQAYDAT